MTNVEMGSTVENFCPGESREEVHLTELLPVKQSAISKNDDDKDYVVADAFKALREGTKHFSLRRNEFCAEDVDQFVPILDELETQSSDTVGEDDLKHPTKDQGRRTTDQTISDKRKGSRVFKKRMKYIHKTRLVQQNKEKHKHDQKEKNVSVVAGSDEFQISNYRKNELCNSDDRKQLPAELLDKHGVFSDEIYVFRQDNCAEAMENVTRDECDEETSKVGKNSSSNCNGRLKLNGTKRNAGLVSNRNNKTGERLTQNERSTKSEVSEDGLREKIDAIIQANYVMERKNNNTTRENRNKLSDALSESSETEIRNSGEESSDKKHRCAICDAKFKGSGGLRTHYKVVHAAGPMFTCDECGKEFPLKERLKLHVRTHTGYKPYKCTECDKSFARGGQLVQHRRTHTQVKPYRCVLCPGTFSCAANLALHVKRHNGQKDHKCDICGRAFVRRDALKKHLECLHKDVKSFLCVICNKTFKGHLPQHMRTHAQDRPHGCATCGQRFAQKSQLTVHQRTHSGQRPFRCLVCWQAFAHSTALKLHTRRHTGERPFKCAECNAGFTQLPHWKKHMRCVHGRTDPYCCKNCNTFFRIKNDLETHEKSCHLAETRLEIDADNRAGRSMVPKYRIMTVEKMRLLLAVLFKRISKPERLDELGFGKRLIDEVLKDSLLSAGKDPAEGDDCNEFEVLKQNLATFLEWTVPREHWEAFKKLNKSPEEILETLTVSQ